MLQLDPAERARLWDRLAAAIEEYAAHVDSARVTPPMEPDKIRELLRGVRFEQPVPPLEALDFAVRNLWRHQTHTPHPRYFGLFNPAPATMGIAADALVAAFNPQIAAWAHSPFAAEAEAHVIRALGERFGFEREAVDGVFCSGGAEANHTALLAALTHRFPGFAGEGVRSLDSDPVLYASAESHDSFRKAARLCGLGTGAVREVPAGNDLRMEPAALKSQVARDRKKGLAPFLVVSTAGTTNAGVIDPIQPLAALAAQEGLWHHVDAAWGGAAALSPKLRGLLDGIEHADSITFDAHKWLSAPMGAGIFLTRDPSILSKTFSTPTAYMPKDASGLDVTDPHLHSMQWSRRFIGLKVLLPMMAAGWDGYAEAIDRMTEMGELLRRELTKRGWRIVNQTPLPVICFEDSRIPDVELVVQSVVRSGEAWISTTRLAGRTVARACITNYRTSGEDVRALADSLDKARRQVLSSAAPDRE